MPSRTAQNRRARKSIRREKKQYSKILLKIVFGVVILFVGFLFYFLTRPSIWNGKDRLVLTRPLANDQVGVVVYDPVSITITQIIIPKNTLVTAARQKGDWQIGSIWKLGKDEKLDGQFLADTVTKSLRFPIDAWVGEIGWSRGSLSIKEQFELALFTLKAQGKVITIPLEETGYLTKTRLKDGDEGFEIRQNLPVKLLRLFYLPAFTQEGSRVGIIDQTSSGSSSRKIAEIVEVLGGKVISIQNQDANSDLDCIVSGNNASAVDKLAHILGCERAKADTNQDLPIIISIGEKFQERF